ncbi:putative transporter [Alternaria arborescens]|uniref:Putative transporter n=1 Tax=Alternaria tenuissima TaxID=119927 RepID=A0A4Q4MMX5_9PLEO|nr:putative transporter [Alternaria arborescens]OWY42404.1 MATE efflux family protein [Alternaria alternata]RYN44348.1 putative transporter [Alternaria arborescens]RYN53419.1 putative transporter [Alternaria tenuissima]RYO39610.1 putative transporter [Alternaria arborescens]
MRRDAPLTAEAQLLAPLWQPEPTTLTSQPQRDKVDKYNEVKHLEYDNDISSLALGFVPFPFTSGGGITYNTMDAPEARRFSTSTAERVGLLKSHDNAAKQRQYGAIPDPSEIESLLGGEGTTEELGTTAGQEAKLLLKYSVPLMGTYLLQYSFSLVTIFVVGHIGTDELGAVSLATMTANITGLAIYEGLATSLDTLCAQAYGSGRKTMVGLHLQRMILFMLAVTIPIGAIWLCSGWILAALVPEKAIAHLAGYYLSLLLAGAPGYAIFEAGKRFTQAQGLFNASLFVLLIATPINIALNYVFVFVLDWDLTGAALATVISNNLLPLLLWIYVYFVNPSSLECWGGFTKAAFTNWGPMAKLAVPGIVMVETEWLAFDILTFSTSYLSTAHLAAQSIVMTLAVAIYHVPFSVGVAVSTRLGNLIGAGSLSAARTATKTYVLTFLAIGLIDFAFLTACRNILPKAFTSDPEVVSIVATVLPLLAAFQFADSTTALVNALLRGLGKQNIGGWCNLFVYYVIAVPLALFLCFKQDMKLVGLWTGCAVGSSCITITEGIYMKFYNWDKAVDDARERQE